MEVTVTVDPDGRVEVTIGDESGYNPEICDDFLCRCRETAVATHEQLITDRQPKKP